MSASATTPHRISNFPTGGGEMGALVRAHDWSRSPLGPIEAWPPALRAIVDMLLASGFPMIALWGPDLVQVYNDGYRDLMGHKHPGGLGQPTRECWPEVWAINGPIYERVLGGETLTFEDMPYPLARRGHPEDAWFTLSYSPLRDEDEQIVGVLVTVFETTGRLRADSKLRESEDRLRAFITNLPGGAVFVVDRDLRYRLAEGEALREAGLQPADLVGKTIDEVVGPALGGERLSAYCRALAGTPFAVEHGEYGRVYLTRGVPLRGAGGAVEGVLAVSFDITARKRAEEALRESEERYRTLFDSIDEGFCMVEVLFDGADVPIDYRFVEVNRAFEAQTGLVDAAGRTMRSMAPGHERHWFDIYGRVALTGEPARFQGGAAALGRWYDVFAFRVGEPGQRRVGILFRDVTERHRAEGERERLLVEAEQARREAEEAVRARDEFLSIASHELRNPVAGIRATAQQLGRAQRGGRLDAARAERYARTIAETSERLGLLIDDLLDVSRLRSGQFPIRPEPTDLAALVRDAVAAQRATGDRHRFRVEADGDATLEVDRHRILQIMANLLDNAVKYSPEGGEVRVLLSHEGDGVRLRVRDGGIGLPEGEAERIFQPFGRAANAAGSNIPGMGLGLYICRRIAEAHGGRLWAESGGEGRGTTVSLWLPARQGGGVGGRATGAGDR